MNSFHGPSNRQKPKRRTELSAKQKQLCIDLFGTESEFESDEETVNSSKVIYTVKAKNNTNNITEQLDDVLDITFEKELFESTIELFASPKKLTSPTFESFHEFVAEFRQQKTARGESQQIADQNKSSVIKCEKTVPSEKFTNPSQLDTQPNIDTKYRSNSGKREDNTSHSTSIKPNTQHRKPSSTYVPARTHPYNRPTLSPSRTHSTSHLQIKTNHADQTATFSGAYIRPATATSTETTSHSEAKLIANYTDISSACICPAQATNTEITSHGQAKPITINTKIAHSQAKSIATNTHKRFNPFSRKPAILESRTSEYSHNQRSGDFIQRRNADPSHQHHRPSAVTKSDTNTQEIRTPTTEPRVIALNNKLVPNGVQLAIAVKGKQRLSKNALKKITRNLLSQME